MKFEVTQDRIYFSDTSPGGWIAGALFMGVGSALLWGALGGFSNYNSVEPWQIYLARLFAVVSIGVGIYAIHGSPRCSLSVHGVMKRIELGRNGAFQSETKVFSFADVAGFANAELFDEEGDRYYELAMDLADGERILVSRSYFKVEEEIDRQAAELNSFLARHSAPLPRSVQ